MLYYIIPCYTVSLQYILYITERGTSMKVKRKKLIPVITILVCLIFSITTIVKNNFGVTSAQNICVDKTGDIKISIKTV